MPYHDPFERIAALEAALEPFVRAFGPAMDAYEQLYDEDAEPREDGEDAGAIYSWALSLTWGDLRRARALSESADHGSDGNQRRAAFPPKHHIAALEAAVADLTRARDGLKAEIVGTDHYAADPRKWGLRSMVKGLVARAEAAEKERDEARKIRTLADDPAGRADQEGQPCDGWIRIDRAHVADLERQLADAREEIDALVRTKAGLTEVVESLEARLARARAALALPLIFHAGGPVTMEQSDTWQAVTGRREMTSKVMGDAIRAVLSDTDSAGGTDQEENRIESS